MAVKVEQPNVLVVEGKEEELFFGALIKHLGLQGIQIMPIGGKEQLRRNLKALVLSPGFSEITSLGIVRDANADPPAVLPRRRLHEISPCRSRAVAREEMGLLAAELPRPSRTASPKGGPHRRALPAPA